MKKLIIIVAVLILVVGGWAIYQAGKSSSNDSTNQDQSSNSSSSSGDVAGQVEMKTMLFTPSQITVKQGETVVWTNNDDTAHTVTADKGDGLDSPQIQPGSTYRYTFSEAGSYQYHCKNHSAMHGTIVVN